jgi:hypothetical protein
MTKENHDQEITMDDLLAGGLPSQGATTEQVANARAAVERRRIFERDKKRREEQERRAEEARKASRERFEAISRQAMEEEIERYKQEEYSRLVSSGLLSKQEFESCWPGLKAKYALARAEDTRRRAEEDARAIIRDALS